MTAFDRCKSIERTGFERLRPYLQEISDGRFVLVNKGPHARRLQEELGDVLVNLPAANRPHGEPTSEAGRLVSIELKTEGRHTGNLFLETWSNRNLGDAVSHAERGSNPGWLFKSRADVLLYYFLDRDILCVAGMLALQRWAFRLAGKNDPWPALKYPEMKQGKYEQTNDTHGVVVPINDLALALGGRCFKVTTGRQLGFFETWDAA